MKRPVVYLNDRFVDCDEAKLSVFDLALLRGYGLYEGIRTYDGVLFRLRDHLDRLASSARKIRLDLRWSRQELEGLLEQLLARAFLEGARGELAVKVIVSGGVDGTACIKPDDPTLILIAMPLTPFPKHWYREGVKLVSCRLGRPYPEAKTTFYMPEIVQMRGIEDPNVGELLLVNTDGKILEGSRSNFFAFKEGRWITPCQGILKGITRQVVLESLCKEYVVEERTIDWEELPTFEAAVVTSTYKGVMPVAQIDGHRMADTQPIAVQRIQELFKEVTSRTVCVGDHNDDGF